MKNTTCLNQFLKYTVLSVLGSVGISCYILADTFFISKGLGANGLAALNIAIPVYSFIYGTGLMLGMGGATRFSVCKSSRKNKETDKIYTNTIYIALIFSVLFFITGLFFPFRLAALLGADENILETTAIYLRWLLLFSPAFIFNNIFLCFIRNDNSPQLPMVAMLTGNAANILLDYIFIFPLKMGIFGAILATGLSPIISIILMLLHWLKKKNTFHLTKTKLSFRIITQEISLGFPSMIIQISSGIVMIIFNLLILKSNGTTGVAAYGVIANISLVTTSIYTGISQGAQPLISSFHGERNNKSIKSVLKYSFISTLSISILIYFILFIFADSISAVFNNEQNSAMQLISIQGLKLYFISLLPTGFNIILSSYFTSVEKPFPSHILTVLRGFVFIIPIVYILSSFFGITGVWLAYPLAEFSTSIIGYFIYRKQKTHHRKLN